MYEYKCDHDGICSAECKLKTERRLSLYGDFPVCKYRNARWVLVKHCPECGAVIDD